MGCSSSSWKNAEATKKDGTTLVEVDIENLALANLEAGQLPNGCTPLVWRPIGGRSGCLVQIPSGFHVFVSRWGKDVEYEDADTENSEYSSGHAAGRQCFCCMTRVTKLVSKQLTVFTVPVNQCKSKDNVDISIDLMILFEIVDGKKFLYKLGAEKLDLLLRASQEEEIRKLASTVNVVEAYDLRSNNDFATSFVKELDAKFTVYGVKIHSFTITDVRLPPDMASHLQIITTYSSKKNEFNAKEDVDLKIMQNDLEHARISEEYTVKQSEKTEELTTRIGEIALEVQEVKNRIAVIRSEGKAKYQESADDMKFDAELEVANKKNETDLVIRTSELEVAIEKNVMIRDARQFEREQRLKKNLTNLENLAEARIVVAQAEANAEAVLAKRRQHEQDMARLVVFEKMSKNRNLRVASTAECESKTLQFKDDSLTRMVNSGVKYATKYFESGAPLQQPLMGGRR